MLCLGLMQLAKEQENSGEMASYRTADTGLIINIGTTTLLCDTSMGGPRPVLPTSWTNQVFNQTHKLSHAGVRPTQRQSRNALEWHGMRRDIRKWCKEYSDCQASKIHRHARAKLTER